MLAAGAPPVLKSIREQLSGVDDPGALLEGLFQHAPVAYQVYRADGHCLLVNQAFRDLFASEPPPEYSILEDDIVERQGMSDFVRRAFAGETVHAPPIWYDPRELRGLKVEEGRRVAIEVTMFPLLDGAGTVRYVALCLKDVTSEHELRAATEALRVSEARYRTQFEAAPEAIVTLDADSGHFVEANQNAERLFGYPRERLMELDPVRLSPTLQPDDRPSAIAARGYIERALRGERPVFAWVHRDATGRDIPCEIRLVRLPGAAANLCRGSIIDVSERKRAEAERLRLETALGEAEEQLRHAQKMEAIGRLAGGIAHDFNNLLSVILSYSEILAASAAEGSAAAADLGEVRRAAQRAADLTRQLLAFSRQQVLAPDVVDLNGVVGQMDRMLRRVIGEDIDLRVIAAEPLGPVKVDPGQIEQVIMNLAVNARDAMPAGGILTIETANVFLDEGYAREHIGLEPGPHIMLAVTDTGVGMDREVQARIFDPFFTTKERGKGTGLGLSTVFGIVRQSGGHIWVYSEPGKGTTFKVYFRRHDTVVEARPRLVGAPSSARGTETLLLVEDEEQLRTLGSAILTRQGYEVIAAESPAAALEACARHGGTIHLLVTDVVLPGMNGRELAARAARLHPEMKILYVSGYTNNTIVHHGVLDEGISFLPKPITPDALVRKVREVLDAPTATAPG